MQIHITARHIELTPALADYARKKFERIARHFEIVLRAQVILSVEKHRHKVMEKLNIHDIAGLTRHAIENGIIESSLQSTTKH